MARPALRLLHLTDTHLHADPAQRLRGVNTHATLSRVLGQAATQLPPADAVLATGDLSQDETPGSYAQFHELLSATGLPVWCIAGNHDAPGPMSAALSTPPFNVGGVHLTGNWCVILLDSFSPGDHGGRLADGQLQWLRQTLHEHHSRHVLLAVHHFPLPLGSRWLDELGLRNAGDLFGIIDGAPQVRALVAGHVHQAADITRKGVRFLATPSTCFQFLPGSDAFAMDCRPPGFRWLNLLDDGSIATEVVWVDPA